jgi:hypothetical protein
MRLTRQRAMGSKSADSPTQMQLKVITTQGSFAVSQVVSGLIEVGLGGNTPKNA